MEEDKLILVRTDQEIHLINFKLTSNYNLPLYNDHYRAGISNICGHGPPAL